MNLVLDGGDRHEQRRQQLTDETKPKISTLAPCWYFQNEIITQNKVFNCNYDYHNDADKNVALLVNFIRILRSE